MQQHLIKVNDLPEFPIVDLTETAKSSFLLIAAEIDDSPFPFFLSVSSTKKQFIDRAVKWRDQVNCDNDFANVVLFKSLVIPPGTSTLLNDPSYKFQYARYDFVMLIESSNMETLENILASDSFKQLKEKMDQVSRSVYITKAVNVKRIAPVDHERQGVFLFNFFQALNTLQCIEVWHYTAGWFQEQTTLNNSVVLLPQDSSGAFSIINHCRWDSLMQVLPALIFKKSFKSYVLRHFLMNQVAPMPILYRMVK